jgi:hypothetical protein
MKEREFRSDPYWQHDFAVDVGAIEDHPAFGIRFKAHESEERYYRGEGDELVPLTVSRGTRRYFHGKPYQLEPDYHLTVALHPVPPPTGEVGVVESSSWEGMRHREIGQAQGWYYPEDRTLILWECFLEERFQQGTPQEDPLHTAVWQAWEQWLVSRSPGVQRIVTTWEDIYERADWQRFLASQRYQQIASAAFAKDVARS